MQPAGGVDDDDVAAVAARALDRVVGDGRRVAAALSLDELRAGALGPDAELLLGRGAERVGRGDDDRVAVLAQAVRELADRRRLAGAVDADDEHDARLAGEVDARRLAEELGDLLRERLVQVAERRRAPRACGRARPSPGTPTSPAISASSSRSHDAVSPGSNVAAASSCVSARRLRPSESRRRENRPARCSPLSSSGRPSPSSSPQDRRHGAER